MKKSIRKSGSIIAAALGLGILFAACSPSLSPVDSGNPTETIVPSATSTIDWFPATPTLSIQSTRTPVPQADLLPGVGSLIYSESFEEPGLWQYDQTKNGNIVIGDGELTMAVLAPKAVLQTFRRDPVLTDFFAEVTVTANLCQGDDLIGLLLRTNGTDSYRYLIDCKGNTSAQVVINGAPTFMQDWTASGELRAGLPAPVKLGVWASRNTLRFFINGQLQFEVSRGVYLNGGIGLYARAASDSTLSVSFSELAVYQVSESAAQTATPVVSTPTP